ncbi:hypothetical protein [Aureivirga marina]|uniref:hypothetical protein n=1 Tax=Aureivirga marina TaxID=1182451 RepID=UPI0018C9B0AF|nr:hypothetical protein [Aureivirga marina]
MSKLKDRNKSILERRFIQKTLSDQKSEIVQRQNRAASISDFPQKREILSSRNISTNSYKLTYRHLLVERFVDMKRLQGRKAINVPIHNRPLLLAYNDIFKNLKYGFTDEIKANLSQTFQI